MRFGRAADRHSAATELKGHSAILLSRAGTDRFASIRPGPFLFDVPSAAAGPRMVIASWSAVLLIACASDGASPHPDLAPVWRDYRALPAERALAIAGDPARDRWVTGASGGHATRGEAEAEALRQCRARRGARRMQAACVLYAVGDEIVWRGR